MPFSSGFLSSVIQKQRLKAEMEARGRKEKIAEEVRKRIRNASDDLVEKLNKQFRPDAQLRKLELGPQQPLAVQQSGFQQQKQQGIQEGIANLLKEIDPKALAEFAAQKPASSADTFSKPSVEKTTPESRKAFVEHFQKTGKRDISLLRSKAPADTTAKAPTDTASFIDRADQQAKIDQEAAGKPVVGLSPGAKNKAGLQWKRAQEQEISLNRFASRTVDAITAQKIGFNATFGKQMALIATAAKLNVAQGIQTPVVKMQQSKNRMQGNLAELANKYINLDSMGAIINIDKPKMDNVFAAGRSSDVGQFFGRIFGLTDQSIRKSINNLRPLILQDIKQSANLSARGLDSDKELDFYMQAATDPKADIQSNIAAIVVLDEAYGNGQIAAQLRNLTDKSLIQTLKQRGKAILNQRAPIEKNLGESDSPEGTTATGPQGQKIITKNGVWVPLGDRQ